MNSFVLLCLLMHLLLTVPKLCFVLTTQMKSQCLKAKKTSVPEMCLMCLYARMSVSALAVHTKRHVISSSIHTFGFWGVISLPVSALLAIWDFFCVPAPLIAAGMFMWVHCNAFIVTIQRGLGARDSHGSALIALINKDWCSKGRLSMGPYFSHLWLGEREEGGGSGKEEII